MLSKFTNTISVVAIFIKRFCLLTLAMSICTIYTVPVKAVVPVSSQSIDPLSISWTTSGTGWNNSISIPQKSCIIAYGNYNVTSIATINLSSTPVTISSLSLGNNYQQANAYINFYISSDGVNYTYIGDTTNVGYTNNIASSELLTFSPITTTTLYLKIVGYSSTTTNDYICAGFTGLSLNTSDGTSYNIDYSTIYYTNGINCSISSGNLAQPIINYSLPSGISSVELYRNDTALASLPASSSSYKDSSLQEYGDYSYYILAVNSSGNTISSNIVSYSYSLPFSSNLNSNKQLTAYTSNNQVVLSWNSNPIATSYNIIDNGSVVANVSSSTNSYTFNPTYPNKNKIYVQSVLSSGYSNSNIVTVDNIVPSKLKDFTLIAPSPDQIGFIGYLDGVVTKCLDNESQNLILYPTNTTMCASAS